MLNSEFQRFSDEWLQRAKAYTGRDQNEHYDKFFTLFVVFNRLYSEATFALQRAGEIGLQRNRPPPDKKGATEYTLDFIGIDDFERLYKESLEHYVTTVATLIAEERFYIQLSLPEGERQPEKDRELLNKLRNSGKTRALAILELIYSIRCNLFHGNKAFQPIQIELLRPVNCILEHVTVALYQKLQAA